MDGGFSTPPSSAPRWSRAFSQHLNYLDKSCDDPRGDLEISLFKPSSSCRVAHSPSKSEAQGALPPHHAARGAPSGIEMEVLGPPRGAAGGVGVQGEVGGIAAFLQHLISVNEERQPSRAEREKPFSLRAQGLVSVQQLSDGSLPYPGL